MEAGGLVVEHHVVPVGDAHKVVAPGGGEEDGQILDVVLVGLHMVGVARVAPHGDAGELAHEVVLQARADDLLGIVEVFRADEAHHRVHQEGLVPLGEAVAPGLHDHLVGPVMRLAGEFAALPGLKVHHVGAGGVALPEGELAGLLNHAAGEAEGLVALLAAGNGLEDEVAGRALAHGLHLGGHMGQDADLGGNLPAVAHLMEAVQHPADALHAVVHGVEAQHRVPRAVGEALQQGGHDAVGVVGGVVGLEAAGEGPRLADGGVAVGGDLDFLRRVDEIHVAHQLGHRRNHLGRQAPGYPPDILIGGLLAEKPLPQLRDRPVLDLGVDLFVHVILNDAGHLVLLVGDGGAVAQVGQQKVRHHHLGGHPLLGGLGGDARQTVAGFDLVCLGQHVLDRLEFVDAAEEFGFEYQNDQLLAAEDISPRPTFEMPEF